METINVNTKIPNLGWHIGAADECSKALQELDMGYSFSIKGQRGSHSAEVWVSDDKKEFFENEILNKIIKGTYRTFYFSKCAPYSGDYYHYYVSYQTNKD